jgi:hypothetical protein
VRTARINVKNVHIVRVLASYGEVGHSSGAWAERGASDIGAVVGGAADAGAGLQTVSAAFVSNTPQVESSG